MGRPSPSPVGRLTTAGALMLLTAYSAGAGRWSGSWASAGASTTTAGGRAVSSVSCTGATCRVLLTGSGSRVHALGADMSLAGVSDGRAQLRVGDRLVPLRAGRTAEVGDLRLTCHSVTGDGLEYTMSRR